MAGTTLIQAAKYRTIVKEVEQFEAATYVFRDKYQGLPGDNPQASRFFSAAECADVGANTCSGDGDEIIGDRTNEEYRYWQHLSLAKLIAGPTNIGFPTSSVPGVDTPLSKAFYAAYQVYHSNTAYGGWFGFQPAAHHFFFYGTEGHGTPVFGNIFTPHDVQAIDVKYDDGLPLQGRIRAATGA